MWRAFTWMPIALSLSACMATQYRAYDAPESDAVLPPREVRYEVADGLYRDPPDCATVLPAPAGTSAEIADVVERAVARNLSEKVEHVIGPVARRNGARRLALDLADNGDRKRFAVLRNCRHFLSIREAKLENVYAVVWAERRLTLSLALHRARDGVVVWRAAHTADRGDGGVPFSPIALGGAAVRAGLHHRNREIIPSLVDDAVRRLFVTLPDMRQ